MSMSDYDKHIADRQQATRLWFEVNAQTFLSKGIYKVTAAYSGSGDDGNTDDPVFYDKTDHVLEGIELSEELTQDLDEHLWRATPAGFENNEGGQGTIVWNTQTGKVHIEHQWNVTTTEEEEYDL